MPNPVKAPGIRTTLVVVLTLVSALPVLLFGLQQSQRWAAEERTAGERRLSRRANSVVREVRAAVETRFQAVEGVADQLSLGGRLRGKDVDALLDSYARRYDLNVLFVTDVKGITLSAYPRHRADGTSALGTDFSDRDYFKAVMSEKTTWGAPITLGRLTGKPVSNFGVPIWNKAHSRIVGLVGASFQIAAVQRLVDQILSVNGSRGGRFILSDQLGNTIADSDHSSLSEIRPVPSFRIFERLSEGETVIREGVDEKGIKVRGAGVMLAVRNYRWPVLILESLDELRAPAEQARLESLRLAGLLALFGFILALVLSYLLSRPVKNLVRAMKSIAETGHSRLGPSKKGAAFAELAVAWQALESMEAWLNAHTENLESLVKERTLQLQETYRALDDERSRGLQSAKLAALAEMAGGLAHEINNPLAIILGKASQLGEMGKSGPVLGATICGFAEKLERASFRIGKILKGLQAISRDGSNDPFEPASLKVLVEDSLELCQTRFRAHGVELCLEFQARRDLRIDCRPTQICQVLLNLLQNAFDAVESLADQKWISVAVTDLGSEIAIRVSDSGKGISEDARDRLFQPFFTTKGPRRGTGLGLSVSHRIVQDHRGRIGLETPDGRTCFAVYLPKTQIRELAGVPDSGMGLQV